jgi:hypothetical protein
MFSIISLMRGRSLANGRRLTSSFAGGESGMGELAKFAGILTGFSGILLGFLGFSFKLLEASHLRLSEQIGASEKNTKELMNARFDGMNELMNARFDGMNELMNARFDGVNARFDTIQKSLDDLVDAQKKKP